MLYDPKWEVEQPVKELEPWRHDLLKAADVIRQKGWCQGINVDFRGRVCLMGALGARDENSIEQIKETEAYKKLRNAITCAVVDLNDGVLKSKEEAIALLEQVANA